MKRRFFIKKSLGFGAGLALIPHTELACSGSPQKRYSSKVILARDMNLLDSRGKPVAMKVANLLDAAMQHFMDTDTPIDAWRSLFKQDESVGLKINCLSGYGSTHSELVEAIIERLLQAGVKQIIIWDRFNSDLEDAGYRVQYNTRVRCYGNDAVGFEDHFESFGQAASLVSKIITRKCDSIINIPLLKDHGIAGMTMALKNMFGAIHNPHKFHLDVGDPYIADVFMYPSIKEKVKLNIADAFWGQYEGGPSYMPQWRWPFSGLLVSSDPVAMDFTGWQIIEEKRAELNLKSLKEMGREPSYIATAADDNHKLGTSNPGEINTVII